jgi:flagellar assembly factor FliW
MKTKYHGEINIEEKTIFTFEQGIPAFEEEKEFVLLSLDVCFSVLQSVHTQHVAFVVADIFMMKRDYDIDLPDSVVEQLQLQSAQDVHLYGIVTVLEPFSQSTINLKAPVVINKKNCLGKQVVLNDNKYETKTPLLFVEGDSAC